MSKSAIYTVNNTLAEIVDGDTIPLGTIIRRYGQNVRQNGNAVAICDKPGCPGYYMVHVVATIETSTAGDYKVKLLQDGIDVIGGVAEINPAPATTILPFPINIPVRNSCGGDSALSIKLEGGDAKIINMTTVVEKL